MATIAFPGISTSSRLPSGTTYNYVHIEPSSEKPYILLLHGFPSSSYDWRNQIKCFSKLGYGIIAPDLLGYGGTDKPKEVESYKLKSMCQDVISILDIEKAGKVYAVGHDWGSFLLSRLANYFPDRFLKFAWLDIAYQAPSGTFDITALNGMLEKLIGYPAFAYWHFIDDADSAELMDRNMADIYVPMKEECTSSLWYGNDTANLKHHICNASNMRSWFTEGKTSPLPPWISNDEMEIHKKILSSKNGGHGPSLNWYRAQMANLNTEDEEEIPPERFLIRQRTLLITCGKDILAIPAMQEAAMRPFVKDLKVEKVETGHWLQLEKPEEVNEILKKFFEEDG